MKHSTIRRLFELESACISLIVLFSKTSELDKVPGHE